MPRRDRKRAGESDAGDGVGVRTSGKRSTPVFVSVLHRQAPEYPKTEGRRWDGWHGEKSYVRASGRPKRMLRIAAWHIGSACCSRSQSAWEYRATESANFNLPALSRASGLVGAAGSSPSGGERRERGVPSRSPRSRSGRIGTVGTGKAARAASTAVDGAGCGRRTRGGT